MNFRFDASDRLAPDPGLFLARAFETRPVVDSVPSELSCKSLREDEHLAHGGAYLPGGTGLGASSSCSAAVAAMVAVTRSSASAFGGWFATKPLAREGVEAPMNQ